MKTTSKEGSVLIVALIFALAISIVSASYLSLALSSVRNADRAFHYNTAFNLAEAGAEEGMWAINNKDWSKAPWVAVGAGYRLSGSVSSPRFTDSQGAKGWYSVYVENALSQTPRITAEGAVKLARSNTVIRKQVRILTANNNLFLPPFTAITRLTLNGGEIDSYKMDSNGDGVPDMNYTDAPRRFETTVASPTVKVGDISIGSPADIYGYVNVGASSSSGFISSVKGAIVGPATTSGGSGVVTSGSNLIDTNRISYDFTQDFPAPKEPAMDVGMVYTTLPPAVGGIITIGASGTKAAPEQYMIAEINIGNKDTIVVVGPVDMIVHGDVKVGGTQQAIQISNATNPDANLKLYARGDISISGNGAMTGATDDTLDPTRFQILGTGTGAQQVTIGGNGNLAASLYAPTANVTMNGGGSSGYFAGAVVANNITVNGNGYRVRFPEEMLDMGTAGSFKVAKWLELDRAADRMSF